MRSVRATMSILGVGCGLFRCLGLFRNPRVNAWHDSFSHHNHGLPSELAILPVLAGIQERTELADLVLKSEQLIRNALWRSTDDQLVADRLHRYFIVRLVAARFEQLDASAHFQFGEQ